MLDTDTKRRIDTARDILVGKVPDPKSQVEQITIALIYKFMDDMDAESASMGGDRKFFTGEFARYGWQHLMHSGLGGHETLALYAEGIDQMPKNPGIPVLFRDIFKNAYLPYRDPETLRAFLKIIDEFSYDHSERLGDAFEYLLSVLGSQGDAGQFRTPRHIIDFMVEVLKPQKNETILDPACGTAGFLISAYKHILRNNVDAKGKSTLTPDDRARLALNFKGYDISPDMVRLSLVNLYLHGFTDPHIYEYDTLTQEDRWNELADVILANPPFMSPKGGIKPHKRFSIDAKRSEVLFVDYMAEHLTANGRAAIIVPEGIIFQSQTSYKALRKMLVDEALVAVVSLPAGCFNPYSGVKTSILILDKAIAKQSDSIAFFKVENDGFGLGAQRREIEKNDLPQVTLELETYLQTLREGASTDSLLLSTGHVVSKEKIAAKGEYGLTGERYREAASNAGLIWPLVSLGDLCVIERGASPRPIHDFMTDAADGVNWIKIGDAEVGGKYIAKTKERVTPEGAAKSRRVKSGDFVLSNSMSFGRPYIMATDGCIHDGWLLLRDHSPSLDQNYLYSILGSVRVFDQFKRAATGGVVNNLNSEIVRGVKIPLPPLEVQKEIVAEIEACQKVIDGARAVLDHYRADVYINSDWPVVELSQVCETILTGPFGTALHQSDYVSDGIPVINPQNIVDGAISTAGVKMVSVETRDRLSEFSVREGDIVIGRRGEMGRCAVVSPEMNGWLCGTGCFVIRLKREYLSRFAFFHISSPKVKQYLEEQAIGVTMKNLNQGILSSIQIPFPPFNVQMEIVMEIEAEQALVSANRELISRFEKKIHKTLERVWGDGEVATSGG